MGKKHVEMHVKRLQKKETGRERGGSEESSPSIFDRREDLVKAILAILVILFMVLSAFMVML